MVSTSQETECFQLVFAQFYNFHKKTYCRPVLRHPFSLVSDHGAWQELHLSLLVELCKTLSLDQAATKEEGNKNGLD